ncbi:MAG TPA: farnesyl diphosphate synthase [Vulgatibacter sp.]|nr:farnesyl diphosphate synthase [Vulgatibacter sp.]
MSETDRFDLRRYLEERRRIVDDLLERAAARWDGEVPAGLAAAMRYGLLGGGKRLRPLLCLAAFDGCGGGEGQRGLAEDFAVAVELVHAYSLVHDDLPAMDDDDLRRGRPTCHKVYGEATAILAGDALLTEAFAVLAAGDEAARPRLCRLLAAAAGGVGMVGGQHLDLEMTGRAAGDGPPPPLPAIEEVHRRKTGALIAAAAEGGAIAAGASGERVASLRRYGQALGLAFQIADDILDVVGDASSTGKSARSDQAKGKPTYPALVGLDKARSLAAKARDRAVEAVEPLGGQGAALRALAFYASDRAR